MEGIYLPKEETAKDIGQFRPVSLLNIDGKIFFEILGKRIIDFVRKKQFSRNNFCVKETV